MIWDKERIRKELRRLDRITGFDGASLPILFENCRSHLGIFYSKDAVHGMHFRFSNPWFQNPDWPVEAAIDVIRHEYAHYLDLMQYGNLGHGRTWKSCCHQIGANPLRCYNRVHARAYRDRHIMDELYREHYAQYQPGLVIQHPVYGMGQITAVEGEGTNTVVCAAFAAGEKRLSAQWIERNCKKVK